MQKTQCANFLSTKEKKTRQMRTCCDCWHIKHGTTILGLLELVAIAFILSVILKRLLDKRRKMNCDRNFFASLFRDCHKWSFSTFDWTLAGDYFITLLLSAITLCVLLLFLGILKKSPYLLLPHLLVQGIFLISSLAYFCLYAWSYFYFDFYQHKKTFRLMAILERMWLATLLLILAAFQIYMFSTVIKCCLYLQDHQNERLRRIKQFEECIKRVRNAKQNGLWRSTSWGGGFQQYIGEYEGDIRKSKKRDKPPAHVQWNLQANREKSISNGGIDDQSEDINSDFAKNCRQPKNGTESGQSKMKNDHSNGGAIAEHSQNGGHLKTRQTGSLSNTITKKYDKQFPNDSTSTTN